MPIQIQWNMKDNAAILTLYDEVQALKKNIEELNQKVDLGISILQEQKEVNVDDLKLLIIESKNQLDEITQRTKEAPSEAENIKRVGEELCQQIAKESFQHQYLKKATHLSNRLSLIIIGIMICSFLFSGITIVLWQKERFKVEVWKNTAATHFEQYQSLKKESDN